MNAYTNMKEIRNGDIVNNHFIVESIEESGEQCTVVFASIVTEPASERVCVCGGGGHPPPHYFVP